MANIDLAPTLLELAGTDTCIGGSCRIMDGRSMLPLLRRSDGSWPNDRGLLVEMHHCRYAGLRADDQSIVAYNSTPARPGTPGCVPRKAYEHYDLEDDPYELRNSAKKRPDLPHPLLERLNALKDCRGIAGRDPAPPGGLSYCE